MAPTAASITECNAIITPTSHMIVRFDERSDAASQGLETSGRVGERSTRIDFRAHASRAAAEARVDQRLQVLEGARAFIATGQSTPLPQREVIRTPGGVVAQETMVIRETTTGFEAVPRIAGDTVFLDISPQRESASGELQRAATTASGRLGEWFEIAGVAGSAIRDDRAILSGTRSRASDTRRIWVKVEELR